MITLTVPDMSCGHCVRTITDAIKAIDPAANVSCDINQRRVTLDTQAKPEQLIQALNDAGYPASE